MTFLSPIILLLILFGAVYLLELLFKLYHLGFYFIPIDLKTISIKPHLNISIIVACKNESQKLPSLFNSLLTLNYPADSFEIIVVNDGSDNATTDLLMKFALENNNVKIISAKNKKYPAKKGAIDIGISNARYNYLMITDADCSVEKDWLLCAESTFRGGADLIFGIAPYYATTRFPKSFFCYEQFYNSITSFTAALSGNPYTAAARSFGYTKDLYNFVGKFDNIQNSLSGDDDLLLLEAQRKGRNIRPIPFSYSGRVFSASPESFKSYLKQKRRHTKASHFYPIKYKLLLTLHHLMNTLLLLSVFLTYQNIIFIIFPFIKISGDLLISKLFANKFDYQFSGWKLIFYVILYELLIPVHIVNSYIAKDRWN